MHKRHIGKGCSGSRNDQTLGASRPHLGWSMQPAAKANKHEALWVERANDLIDLEIASLRVVSTGVSKEESILYHRIMIKGTIYQENVTLTIFVFNIRVPINVKHCQN